MTKYIILIYVSLVSFIASLFLTTSLNIRGYEEVLMNIPHPDALLWIFFLVTDMGGLVFILLSSLALCVYLLVKERFVECGFVVISLIAGVLFQVWVKNMLDVIRPPHAFVGTVGFSFPSGHTNMVTLLCMLYLLYVGPKKALLKWGLIILPVCVALSRVYLGAHWPLDVFGGYASGVFLSVVPFVLYREYASRKKVSRV